MENDYQQILPKVSGYLEKKGRKKMMSCYKKYWFVLEGRLLLYYKSKDEYEAISPCKGSINLGPTCSVKPGVINSGVFQIESKTTTITLRAESREEQQKWMQALMSALNQRKDFKKLNHFRHSTGDLSPIAKRVLLDNHQKFDTGSMDFQMTLIEKLQKMGARSYGIAPKLRRSKTTIEKSFSHESLPTSKRRPLKKSDSVIVEHPEYSKMAALRRRNSVESAEISSEDIYERIPSADSLDILRDRYDYNDNNIHQKSRQVEENIYAEAISHKDSAEKDKKSLLFAVKRSKNSKENVEDKQKKTKRSESFLRRMWSRKIKSKKQETLLGDGETEEPVDSANMSLQNEVEKLSIDEKQLRGRAPDKGSEVPVQSETVKCRQPRLERDDIGFGQAGPSLPPRNQKNPSRKAQMAPSVPPKRRAKNTEALDSLLGDLNTFNQPQSENNICRSEGKVKQLIKRFSDEGVELRNKDFNHWKPPTPPHSQELDNLLDELAKITTAPIMTPGVTTSLINPDICDREVERVTRRRMSDPDYDVPRPHTSLINLPRKQDNALKATRFFGPVLNPSDFEQKPSTPPADYHSNLPSITPDSLEVEGRKTQRHSHEELRISYESHHYANYNKASHYNLNFLQEKNVYADPRLRFRVNSESDHNVFVDSLES